MKRITHTNDSLELLYQAQRRPGWQVFSRTKRTVKAIQRAWFMGCIEVRGREYREKETKI